MEFVKLKLPLIAVLLLSLLFNAYFVLTGVVSRVVDGDTFDLEDNRRIRLAGADAPEYPKECLSLEAKNRLSELILGKNIFFKVVGTDNFSRQIAYIFLDDVLLDKVLVEEGLAKASPNSPEYDPFILTAQDEAKKLKKGIWSSLCQAKENCLIKGNVRKDKDTKIYHMPDCYNYPKIVINESQGDSWFCSEKEALEAGFTKSEDCPNPD